MALSILQQILARVVTLEAKKTQTAYGLNSANVLGTSATDVQFTVSDQAELSPNTNRTLTTAVPAWGTVCKLKITQPITTSRTMTFGTGFLAGTATLATGTVAGAFWVITYVSNGVAMVETSRLGPY